MTAPPPPPDPTADPLPLVTAAEVARLRAVRARRPWYDAGRAPDVEPVGDAAFLLDLVDRLLGRALLPDEDPWREDPDADVTVTSGPSLYMCGHGDWHVRVRGRPGILASLTANPLDAARLRALLNPPTVRAVRAALTGLDAVLDEAVALDRADDSPAYHTARAVRAWRDRLVEEVR